MTSIISFDVLRCQRLDVRPAHAEALHVYLVRVDVLARDLRGRDALLLGAIDDLVVHVGEVPHIRDLVPRRRKYRWITSKATAPRACPM